ncbi:unnamed protein product [Linum trigynum]|uniref:Uncharacterized protein n=1 Tax=Linum trigynum TaxID=586398 RepID=A0AAV2FVL7_9ROSI
MGLQLHDGYDKQYANLLVGLSNAQTLILQFDTLEPSPFTRLKSLSLLYSEETVAVTCYVMRFFCDGSPFMDENSVKLTKVTTSSFSYNMQVSTLMVNFCSC